VLVPTPAAAPVLVPTPAAAPVLVPAVPTTPGSFQASPNYAGFKRGYVFQMGGKGLGYYPDTGGKPTTTPGDKYDIMGRLALKKMCRDRGVDVGHDAHVDAERLDPNQLRELLRSLDVVSRFKPTPFISAPPAPAPSAPPAPAPSAPPAPTLTGAATESPSQMAAATPPPVETPAAAAGGAAPAAAGGEAPAEPIYSHYIPGGIPANWKVMDRSKFEGNGCAVDVTSMLKDDIEVLMNNTADPTLHGRGRDAQSLDFDKFVVTKVERIQNMQAWTQYNLKKELGEPHTSVLMDNAKAPNRAKRSGRDMPLPTALNFRREANSVSLDARRNEHLLFHGTKPDIKEVVTRQGFDPRVGGGLYGTGVYFAESVSKAQQYVPPNASGEQWMFLARVYLGTPHHTSQAMNATKRPPCVEMSSCEKKGLGCWHPRCDSIIAETHHFREFVIYDADLAYPEYAIRFERHKAGKKVA